MGTGASRPQEPQRRRCKIARAPARAELPLRRRRPSGAGFGWSGWVVFQSESKGYSKHDP